MRKVLALTRDGSITFCTAKEENIGKKRCNHIAHQKEGESEIEFITRIEGQVSVHSDELKDQKDAILKLVGEYGNSKNPDWQETIKGLENHFHIGTGDDYEEAEMIGFNQTLIEKPDGDAYELRATYLFRGEEYELSYGEVPVVHEDGTIRMNDVDWRVLPVVQQHKAGLVSYHKNIVVKQKDGRNVAFSMSKDPEEDFVKIYGDIVPLDKVEAFYRDGSTEGLSTAHVYALTDVDPIVFERFENFGTDLRSLKELPSDEPGDLNYRRVDRYEDMVAMQMSLQSRRMGTTFRANLAKRQLESNADLTKEELDAKFPLFYQQNLTENIKSDLVKRSNVQNADNLNPIAALSQSQKLSYTGPGGYSKDSAPYDLRMPHKSHELTIDAMDVSSGKNVGLTGTLSYGEVGSDRMIRPKNQEECLAPSDFVPFRYHNDPNRGVMAVAHMKQACPIVGGEDPLVSTQAWDKIQGSKLGANLNIAYVPMGETYEDAVIISESAAEKMATVQSKIYQVNDTQGLQVGQRLERKDKMGGTSVKYGGVIKSIKGDHVELETTFKMTPGDKLAGRHGNKSVVSEVWPDSKMPKTVDENGNVSTSQIVMSPLSVVGRKNLGQIMETNESVGNGSVIDKKNKVVLNDGTQIEATSGKQFIMRLNHIAEKKLASYSDETTAKKESSGLRLGEMEAILLSQNKDRLKILDYLRHQESYDSHNKLNHLLKAVGVSMDGVGWNKQ